MKTFRVLLLIVWLALSIYACGGGGGGGGDDATPSGGPTIQQGQFLDSVVQGLRYTSGSQSGYTDENGYFSYESGSYVQFYVGDILIGQASGMSKITPVALVSGALDETNENVTNITRFLLTLDDDYNANNGIIITSAVSNAAMGLNINFAQTISNFESDSNVSAITANLTALTSAGVQPLVSSIFAQTHLNSTIMGHMAGWYTGAFSGDASGTWSVTIDLNGNISGATINSSKGETKGASGSITSNGNLSMIAGHVTTGAIFSGTVSLTGEISGTWVDASANEKGIFSGSER